VTVVYSGGSSYTIIAGRSASITGPYVDPQGTGRMNAGGMEVQGADQGMIGPGSAYVFQDGSHSDLVYHYDDAFDSGDAGCRCGRSPGRRTAGR
jgi:arabinan endo-1,5-alpha-L-arabinosidase